jgi:hypothetical protein
MNLLQGVWVGQKARLITPPENTEFETVSNDQPWAVTSDCCSFPEQAPHLSIFDFPHILVIHTKISGVLKAAT